MAVKTDEHSRHEDFKGRLCDRHLRGETNIDELQKPVNWKRRITPEEYKEKNRIRSKRNYERHRDEILAKCKEYYTNNKDKAREYYQKNRERCLLRQKYYRGDIEI